MKSTKKSLLLSVLSLVLCFAMLLGTTWAWFTDKVESGVNQIKAGNLDIEVSYKDGEEWKSIEGVDSLFSKGLWEPGHTEYVNLKIENKGTLALKYQMSVSPVTETAGTNVAGESFKLSDYLMFGTKAYSTEPTYADRAAARTDVEATATGLNQAALSQPNTMLANAEPQFVTLVIYMPETVGNEANYRGTAPQIDLGITVVATQVENESDSFGKDYDAITPWLGGTDAEGLAANANSDAKTVKIESAEQLAAFAAAVNKGETYDGYTVTLAKDIDLNNVEWIQINGAGHNITLDGNSKTIKNLKVSSGHNAGLFATGSGCTIKNLTVDGATVKGVGRIAVICGHGMCVTVDKCTVKNATVTAVVTNNDDGDKAGAIVGYLSAEPNAKVTNCTVEGCTVTGYRDIGGLVGYAGGTYTVTDNTVNNCTVINDRSNNYNSYAADAAFDVNAIIGEKGASGTESNNTSTNVKVVAGATMGAAVKNAISEATAGDTIPLPTTDEAIALPKNIASNVTIDGGNAEDTTISLSQYGSNEPLNNVTLKNVTISGPNAVKVRAVGDCTFDSCIIEGSSSALRETYIYNGTLSFVNCKIDGAVYGIHIGGANAGAQKLVIDNCEISGWNSFAAALPFVEIKNSTFHKSGYGCLRFYQNASITNCKFDDAFEWIDISADNVTVTMTGNTGIDNAKLFNNEIKVDNVTRVVTGTKFIVDGVETAVSAH